jgi:hypothetical protein
VANGLSLTKRFQGATESFVANFQAVKGGKVLVMVDGQQTYKYLVKKR